KVVVKIPCLLNSLRSPSSMVSKRRGEVMERWSVAFPLLQHSTTPSLQSSLLPRQHAFLPRPNQSLNQQQQKDRHGDKCASRQSGEGDGEGQQKDRFNVEDQEDDGIEVILGLELDPG